MEIAKTVILEKSDEDRYYDLVRTRQGYAVQRNGYTVYGRLSSVGADQLFAELVKTDEGKGWEFMDSRKDFDIYDDMNYLF